MHIDDLKLHYNAYVECLNKQNWPILGQFVSTTVRYNGKTVGLSGYRDMLMQDFKAIPDLQFNIGFLVCEPTAVACILNFDCTPVGYLFDLPVQGRRVRFAEHVFYTYEDEKIKSVWSVIDKAAIAAQLQRER